MDQINGPPGPTPGLLSNIHIPGIKVQKATALRIPRVHDPCNGFGVNEAVGPAVFGVVFFWGQDS